VGPRQGPTPSGEEVRAEVEEVLAKVGAKETDPAERVTTMVAAARPPRVGKNAPNTEASGIGPEIAGGRETQSTRTPLHAAAGVLDPVVGGHRLATAASRGSPKALADEVLTTAEKAVEKELAIKKLATAGAATGPPQAGIPGMAGVTANGKADTTDPSRVPFHALPERGVPDRTG